MKKKIDNIMKDKMKYLKFLKIFKMKPKIQKVKV